MFAGHGERDVVRTLAGADPDDDVRATACHYLALTTGAADGERDRFLAERLAEDSSPTVRLEDLELVRAGRATVPASLMCAAAADEDIRIRVLAATILLDEAGRGATAMFPEVLEARVLAEPDSDLRRRLIEAYVALGGERLIVHRVANEVADASRVAELLNAVLQAGGTAEWSVLNALIDKSPTVDEVLARLIAIATRPWDRTPAVGPVDLAGWVAMQRLKTMFGRLAPHSVAGDDRAAIHQIAQWLEDEVAQWLEDEVDDGWTDLDDEFLRDVRRVVEAWS